MSFITDAFKSLNKKVKQYFNPNENPTQADKYAFKFLMNINVEEFIEFVDRFKVNINAVTFQGVSFLTMAVQMANRTARGMTQEDVMSKCIIAINFILSKGANIDHQDKNGRTALLAACHWRHPTIAQLLIKHGANLDLSTTQSGWVTNPLIAACFKQDYQLIELLVVNGASIEKAIQLNKQANGFRLAERELHFLEKAQNIKKLLLIKAMAERSTKPGDKQKFWRELNLKHVQRIMEIC